ncbi:hypothetical protein A200_00995 [Parascardovia denticolens IPLA 20019]|uniref:hypothetical protein n=1 Tax=Parascardovia denticolens TaxID=78258 RepID=UPI000266BADA|nr:hypothetical protein [Parascardovia denticolens]EIT89032.1 hypothetical protein A200_00995 [Parascardovia denticolens IPLA 20019]
MKSKIIVLISALTLVLTMLGVYMTHTQSTSAAAATPRAYTVIVLDQNRGEEISLRHAWEAHGESGSTTAWDTMPAKGDAFSLSVSATTPAYAMLHTTSVSGMSNTHISRMNVEGVWGGGAITLTMQNGTTITLDPTSPQSGLTIQEK